MADFTFNISKGRTVEYHERVNNNDPANSALILVVLAESGLEADDVLIDYNDLQTLLAGTSNEPTNTGYARKTLTDADIAAVTTDDTLNRQVIAWTSSQTYTTPTVGDSWRKLLVCYDSDTTSGTDANIIPVTAHDLLLNGAAIIPSGTANIVIANPTGYVIAA